MLLASCLSKATLQGETSQTRLVCFLTGKRTLYKGSAPQLSLHPALQRNGGEGRLPSPSGLLVFPATSPASSPIALSLRPNWKSSKTLRSWPHVGHKAQSQQIPVPFCHHSCVESFSLHSPLLNLSTGRGNSGSPSRALGKCGDRVSLLPISRSSSLRTTHGEKEEKPLPTAGVASFRKLQRNGPSSR